ncbi:MAG: SEC-C domain-containing protein [Pseudomonadota bacterium]
MNTRNSPCACGSGKKYKHCCLSKKPRTRTVTVDMGRSVTMDAVRFDPKTGEVEFFHQGKRLMPMSSKVELTYPRQKGAKVVGEAAISGSTVVVDTNRALEQYDMLVAVDTNTQFVGSDVISMACLVVGKPIPGYAQGHTAIGFGIQRCFEFWGARDSQERIAWTEVIEAMHRNREFSDSMRVGMIVDAYLGSLPKINTGEEAVYGDVRLPKNFSLIYASTDAPNDGIANKMLSLADMQSRELLNYVIRDRPQQNLDRVQGKPFSRLRVWQRSSSPTPISGAPRVRPLI